jgi:hypothetical protein
VRIVFDENTPKSVARAIKLLAEPEFSVPGETLQILHALDVIAAGTPDTTLIQSIADGTHAKSALITTDKSMRTRHHERAAFHQSGCIGIILRQNWNHASLWSRAHHTLLWWPTWQQTIYAAAPGSLWQCPWSQRPKPLKLF